MKVLEIGIEDDIEDSIEAVCNVKSTNENENENLDIGRQLCGPAILD